MFTLVDCAQISRGAKSVSGAEAPCGFILSVTVVGWYCEGWLVDTTYGLMWNLNHD
jgi:hypothetical protein